MKQDAAAQSKLWYLRHIRLFSGLSQAELQEMDRITRSVVVFPKGSPAKGQCNSG